MAEVSVSVLMSCYNDARYVGEAIESVLSQSFDDFEFIIINDGSTDESESVIKSYFDERIKYINQPNQGLSKALNKGLSLAKGEFIARLDSDDIAYPDRLEKQHQFLMLNPEYVLIGSAVENIDKDGNHVYDTIHPLTDQELRKKMQIHCPVAHTTAFYKRDIAIKCGGYYEPIKQFFEDHMLWYQMAQHGKIGNLPDILMKYRLHPHSITEKNNSSEYLTLVSTVVRRGSIYEDELKWLFKYKRKRNSSLKTREISYYKLLAKKYLWDNPRKTLARKNLSRVISRQPFRLTNYLLFFLTFLPSKLVSDLYRWSKKKP
ncbi:MAG: hypothetical protein Tsb0034_02630 [Ekhidna sp.]